MFDRNVLGTKCLADILSEREKIANWMEQTLGEFHKKRSSEYAFMLNTFCNFEIISDEATDPWGVKVERVEM